MFSTITPWQYPLGGVVKYLTGRLKFHQQDKIDNRAAPGRLPVPGMGLSKYTVGTPEGEITMDYIMIGDKNQVRIPVMYSGEGLRRVYSQPDLFPMTRL